VSNHTLIKHLEISNKELRNNIKNKIICFAGNSKLKIYGTLDCKSGKRMKKGNRVFFKSKHEALMNGYRPCGHCMYKTYADWKRKSNESF
jgi:methylphosphotriester-DNA--protein-cysteine methyltransferase